jgi:hypothetical protein
MKDLKNNIKFNYLYRDAGNYKKFGSIVFSNPDQIEINQVELEIRKKLFDTDFFIPKEWDIPTLHFEKWNEELDHFFHEFDSVEICNDKPNDCLNRSILKFMNSIKSINIM